MVSALQNLNLMRQDVEIGAMSSFPVSKKNALEAKEGANFDRKQNCIMKISHFLRVILHLLLHSNCYKMLSCTERLPGKMDQSTWK